MRIVLRSAQARVRQVHKDADGKITRGWQLGKFNASEDSLPGRVTVHDGREIRGGDWSFFGDGPGNHQWRALGSRDSLLDIEVNVGAGLNPTLQLFISALGLDRSGGGRAADRAAFILITKQRQHRRE